MQRPEIEMKKRSQLITFASNADGEKITISNELQQAHTHTLRDAKKERIINQSQWKGQRAIECGVESCVGFTSGTRVHFDFFSIYHNHHLLFSSFHSERNFWWM